MTTRRDLLTLAGAIGVATVAGCTRHPAASGTGRSGGADVLFVDLPDGLGLIRGGRVRPLGTAVLSPDGSRAYPATPAGADTDLACVFTSTGEQAAVTRLPGRWVPRIAGTVGPRVALSPPQSAGTGYLPPGQARTSLLIAGPGVPSQHVDLPGNLVPDAFATGDLGMFVLDWLPPAAPDHYRVRQIDFGTGLLGPLLTRDKVPIPAGAEEEMRGERRLAVYGADYQMLYTLYAHQPDHVHTRDLLSGKDSNVLAFVHSLNVGQHWAYCVDLPAPFGAAPVLGHTITVAPDGQDLYVADVGSGSLAEIDTSSLSVRRVARFPSTSGIAYAACGIDTVYLAAGRQVHVVERGSLQLRATWSGSSAVRGMALSLDGARLFLGLADRIAVLDAASGTTRDDIAVPGLVALDRVG